MVYCIPAVLLFLISVLYYSKETANKSLAKVLWVFFCVYVVIIIGCRYKVGTDWDSYFRLFNEKQFDFNDGGIAFYVIKTLIKGISLGFQTYVFIMFMISFVVKTIALKKITDKYFICLLLYFSFWYLTYESNGIRQGAAFSFILYAVYYTIKGNCKKYIFCVFLAFCFHNAAIIFLPFYWLTKFHVQKIWMYITIAFAILFSHLGIGESIIMLFSERYIDSYFAQRSISYAIDEAYNANVLLSFKSIHRIALLVVIFELSTKYKCSEKMKSVLVWAAFLSGLIYFSFCQFEVIATRLSLYYRIVEIIGLSFLPFIYKKNWQQFLIIFLLFVYSLFQIWNVMQIPDGGLFPYRNCLL